MLTPKKRSPALHDSHAFRQIAYTDFLFHFVLLQIVRDAETLSARMNHRGACACDNDTGDGAGVLCAIPHEYYADELR